MTLVGENATCGRPQISAVRFEAPRRYKLAGMRSARVAVVLDACCVLIFVIIGRASHTKGETLAGIASTAWPFLCGLAAGWAVIRAWRRPLAIRPSGLVIWLGTVAVGMVLRVVSGQGTAVAFIIVALAFLGLFLLGWRLIAALALRRAVARL
jgi:hypothetical protein